MSNIEESIARRFFTHVLPTDALVDPTFLAPWLKERALRVQPLAFPPVFALGSAKLEAVYSICRLSRPTTVVETGVANGASSAVILKALAENQRGELWSVDRPPLTPFQKPTVGSLVPELTNRWHLLFKDGLRGLSIVLRSVPSVDVFLHDSKHTYSRMSKEFCLV